MISKNHKGIFILAIIGCFLGVVADTLLLYTPNGNYEVPGYHFLTDIEIPRMTIGLLLVFLLFLSKF